MYTEYTESTMSEAYIVMNTESYAYARLGVVVDRFDGGIIRCTCARLNIDRIVTSESQVNEFITEVRIHDDLITLKKQELQVEYEQLLEIFATYPAPTVTISSRGDVLLVDKTVLFQDNEIWRCSLTYIRVHSIDHVIMYDITFDDIPRMRLVLDILHDYIQAFALFARVVNIYSLECTGERCYSDFFINKPTRRGYHPHQCWKPSINTNRRKPNQRGYAHLNPGDVRISSSNYATHMFDKYIGDYNSYTGYSDRSTYNDISIRFGTSTQHTPLFPPVAEKQKQMTKLHKQARQQAQKANRPR